ncbi:MAG: 2-phospho-L-lactate guanylyltransferase [Acidimicrobiales bacterium]
MRSAERRSANRAAVLVPVKAFAEAKRRLAPTLDPLERRKLARAMADQVLTAATPLCAVVVCDDAEVMAWARRRGALVVWEPGRGLNGAVQAGVARLCAAGAGRVVVAHSDLPLATELAWVAEFDGVTLVPDRRDDGTNVICVPAGCGFRFSYGPGSFTRHRGEAIRLGIGLRVVHEPLLGHDVDLPADLVGAGPLADRD